ncbi:hypothetical protein ACFLQ3_00575 [Bacteroidota bacterium]
MIKKRLILLTVITLIGGFLFVPYSNETWTLSLQDWLIFPFGSAIVILLFGWLGLIIADKTNLPMPILRKWESNEKIKKQDWKVLFIPALLGAGLALIIAVLNQFFNVPKNPGTFLMRILTTPWAATVTEVVSHLLVMSLIILLLKNKWLGIILSSLIFLVLFHLQGIEGDLKTTIFLGAGNFTGSTLTGWFYSKYGFESAIVGHATMHLILLAIN